MRKREIAYRKGRVACTDGDFSQVFDLAYLPRHVGQVVLANRRHHPRAIQRDLVGVFEMRCLPLLAQAAACRVPYAVHDLARLSEGRAPSTAVSEETFDKGIVTVEYQAVGGLQLPFQCGIE